MGNSREILRSFPEAVREDVGFQVFKVQQGREPDDWKALPTIGAGVAEIRAQEGRSAFRVIYVAKFPEAIYVLHAFQKKTAKTSRRDLDLVNDRYRRLVEWRTTHVQE